MDKQLDPMNIDLLILDKNIISKLMEVKTRDIFMQNSTEFHHEGLFSTTIFGNIGTPERLTTFGYVDLGLSILHPRVYKELISINSLYKDILNGSKYAIYDPKTKDFIESDQLDGRSGFNFFMEYYDKLNFKETDSIQREFKIKFLTKYKASEVVLDKYLVMPAGLRDYTITESGKAMENEINNFYRKLLTVSSTAKAFKTDTTNKDNEYVSAVRSRLQKVAVDIYDQIETLLDGKSKFIQGKWTKRGIMYGTRNVLTSIPIDTEDLEDEHKIKANNSIVGLFETLKGLLPISIFQVRTRFLQDIFDINSSKALLVDNKTYKRVPVDISEKTRSRWVTDEGLEETINKLVQDEIKNSYINIDGYSLLLVYEHDDKIDILKGIDDLPDLKKEDLRPITYGELFYLSIFNIISNYPAFITRYPIVNYGGIVPTEPYLKTTIKSNRRYVKLINSSDYILATEYPIVNEHWSSSVSVPQHYLEGLGADFDGFREYIPRIWEFQHK